MEGIMTVSEGVEANLHALRVFSVTGSAFGRALRLVTTETLEKCFSDKVISKDTEKCCRIYAELYRRRHSAEFISRVDGAC